jgi:hypothetical protein
VAWEELIKDGQFDVIPETFSWEQSARFAHMINGYAIMGDALGDLANERLEEAEAQGTWRGTAKELWLCLFFEHRRWRHFGESPSGKELKVLNALCQELRKKLVLARQNERDELLNLLTL